MRKWNEHKGQIAPSFSRTVAYRELARGHDCRLHSPVTLYSFLQKFCVVVLQKTQTWMSFSTSRSHSLDFVWAEMVIYHWPDNIITLHNSTSNKPLATGVQADFSSEFGLAATFGQVICSSLHQIPGGCAPDLEAGQCKTAGKCALLFHRLYLQCHKSFNGGYALLDFN